MSFIKEMESKITDVQEQLKKHTSYASEIVQGIKKLQTDKMNTINNAHILNGALQAYTDVLKMIKEQDKPLEGE